jgi:2-keto-3-deoxy-L-rhamnonate aldolase RhmA
LHVRENAAVEFFLLKEHRMTTPAPRIPSFRRELLAGKPLFGLFTRLADTEAVEALGASALDFVVLDVEHASLGRDGISRVAATARACDLPLVVRLAAPVHADIHHAIAVGAAGLIVSHVASGEQARRIAEFARGAALERAYAGMGRAADFRRPSWTRFRAELADRFAVIAQIDDAAGLGKAGEIAAANGIDALFAGSLSLALSCGSDPADAGFSQRVMVELCAACRPAGRRLGMHAVSPADFATWSAQGVNLFVVGNDLNLLRLGADGAVAALRGGGQALGKTS